MSDTDPEIVVDNDDEPPMPTRRPSKDRTLLKAGASVVAIAAGLFVAWQYYKQQEIYSWRMPPLNPDFSAANISTPIKSLPFARGTLELHDAKGMCQASSNCRYVVAKYDIPSTTEAQFPVPHDAIKTSFGLHVGHPDLWKIRVVTPYNGTDKLIGSQVVPFSGTVLSTYLGFSFHTSTYSEPIKKHIAHLLNTNPDAKMLVCSYTHDNRSWLNNMFTDAYRGPSQSVVYWYGSQPDGTTSEELSHASRTGDRKHPFMDRMALTPRTECPDHYKGHLRI